MIRVGDDEYLFHLLPARSLSVSRICASVRRSFHTHKGAVANSRGGSAKSRFTVRASEAVFVPSRGAAGNHRAAQEEGRASQQRGFHGSNPTRPRRRGNRLVAAGESRQDRTDSIRDGPSQEST